MASLAQALSRSGSLHEHIDDQLLSSTRRLRHISSIQICNLSPFPVRDAAASALSQPSEQPQFTHHGHLSDDLDVALARKRSRRISAASVSTVRSGPYDPFREDAPLQGAPMLRGRNRAGSRGAFVGEGARSVSSGLAKAGTASSPPTVRPARPRTTSIASSLGRAPVSAFTFQEPASAMSTATFSIILPDQSQHGLDKLLKSRLVETFLSITVPTPVGQDSDSDAPPLSPKVRSPPRRGRPPGALPLSKDRMTSPLSAKSATTNKRPLSVSELARLHSPPSTPPPDQAGSSKSAFVSSSSAPVLRPKPLSPTSVGFPSSSSSPVPSLPSVAQGSDTPAYLSDVHRPSTNPAFPISAEGFAPWIDQASSKLRVEVFGKVGSAWGQHSQHVSPKGKEKEAVGGDDGWKVLESWSFDLSDLIPLPDDVDASPTSHLPSNSLLITLGPLNTTYYLPPTAGEPTHPSRPSTPTAGYNSDPESDARRSTPAPLSPTRTQAPVLSPARSTAPPITPAASEFDGSQAGSRRAKDRMRTAGFQDLVKLATMQTSLAETRQELDDVTKELERTMLGDGVAVLKRDVSEREGRLQELRDASTSVFQESDDLQSRIEERRQQLAERRKLLASAQQGRTDDAQVHTSNQTVLANEHSNLSSLRARLAPIRTAHITTLAGIFPIDLFAPADLLFTIVGVPLPIPVAPSDPAPPLSVPAHKAVTEDAVAGALGFAAQVVQMLAAYLGKRLVYPVTCVGSRSLIKDEISAMMGPRMFPLYSKGVDTYRFEYGVFLLNKNIELLMADRDLRALDIRHTLPNLKNLLLTLTDGEGGKLVPTRQLKHAASLLSLGDLRSPTPEPASPVTSTGTEESSSTAPATPEPGSPTTPMATPTVPSKKPVRSSYFGFAPLSGFLRGRYPSTASSQPSVKAVPEASEEGTEGPTSSPSVTQDADEGGAEDEEDRRTVRGVPVGGAAAHADEEGGPDKGEGEGGKEAHGPTNGRVVLVADRSKEQPLVVTLQPASPSPAAVR